MKRLFKKEFSAIEFIVGCTLAGWLTAHDLNGWNISLVIGTWFMVVVLNIILRTALNGTA